jgi:hypothetical protein
MLHCNIAKGQKRLRYITPHKYQSAKFAVWLQCALPKLDNIAQSQLTKANYMPSLACLRDRLVHMVQGYRLTAVISLSIQVQ